MAGRNVRGGRNSIHRIAPHRRGSWRSALLPGLLLTVAGWALPANAEHAVIDLRVISPNGQATATTDQEPPAGGVNPRSTMAVRVGERLLLQFILTNAYPHGVLKEAIVRYFVVRVDKMGQKKLPDLKKGVVTQGRVVMDLKPKCRVGARMQFRIDQPGVYLVRVDTLNTHSDHEHFAAIDLEAR